MSRQHIETLLFWFIMGCGSTGTLALTVDAIRAEHKRHRDVHD